jgi:hypothetical protein
MLRVDDDIGGDRRAAERDVDDARDRCELLVEGERPVETSRGAATSGR